MRKEFYIVQQYDGNWWRFEHLPVLTYDGWRGCAPVPYPTPATAGPHWFANITVGGFAVTRNTPMERAVDDYRDAVRAAARLGTAPNKLKALALQLFEEVYRHA